MSEQSRNTSQLIRRLQSGDQRAFKDLFDLYQQDIYSTALNYSNSPSDAKDITQEVFIKIFRSISSFQAKSTLRTWIYRITVNTALSWKKKHRKHQDPTDLDVALTHSAIDDSYTGQTLPDTSQNLRASMSLLPDNQRIALILSYIESLPRQEVADILNLSLKAVESLLMRGKKNMRRILQNQESKS